MTNKTTMSQEEIETLINSVISYQDELKEGFSVQIDAHEIIVSRTVFSINLEGE